MQPIPAQDRPKLIAVVIGIVIALVFVVRNLMGTQTLAQPKAEEKVTTNTAPAAPAAPPAEPTGTAAELSLAAADSASTGAGGSGLAELPPLRDPFQPLEKIAIAPAPVAAAPAPTPAAAKAPVLPSFMPAPGQPAEVAIAVRSSAPALRVEPERDGPDASPAQPAEKSAAPAPASPSEEVRLVGTVRQNLSALAVFRGSERAVFIRPKEVIAHWRVIRIDDGQVRLSHNNTRELVRVGEILPSVP
jgi:hypothetical protein